MVNGRPITSETFQLAATGDTIINRPLEPPINRSDGYDPLISALDAVDATVTNLEVVLNDRDGHATLPRKIRDLYQYLSAPVLRPVRSDPELLTELTDIGINLFSVGNNHSLDYGRVGIQQTIAELESHGVTYAGIGKNLPIARSPSYLSTSNGRVGLVHACSSYQPGSEGGQPSSFLPGKPGISPLHVYWNYNVPPERLRELQEIADLVGIDDVKHDWWLERENWYELDDELFPFMHMGFRAVEDPTDVGIDLSVHPPDRTAVLSQVEEANEQADWVVMTVHSHQGAGGARNVNTTPSFLIDFAHDAIDAGADAFVCTGPHVLRGIELYEGKPIFYSLGNFILQSETQQYLPAESYARTGVADDTRPSKVMDKRSIPSDWWRSVVPLCQFDRGGELISVELLPITLGEDDPRSQRGIPTLASGQTRDRIVRELQGISDRFDTQLVVEKDSVVVKQN